MTCSVHFLHREALLASRVLLPRHLTLPLWRRHERTRFKIKLPHHKMPVTCFTQFWYILLFLFNVDFAVFCQGLGFGLFQYIINLLKYKSWQNYFSVCSVFFQHFEEYHGILITVIILVTITAVWNFHTVTQNRCVSKQTHTLIMNSDTHTGHM